VNAPVGIGNVEGITVEAPLPSVIFKLATDRFDRGLAALDDSGAGSVELLCADFGAVVFAITLFLS
jgi:hypothetical protein